MNVLNFGDEKSPFNYFLGSLVATGSADCSIKILDVEKIIAREVRGESLTESGPDAHHPVIRTLYDHLDVTFLFISY